MHSRLSFGKLLAECLQLKIDCSWSVTIGNYITVLVPWAQNKKPLPVFLNIVGIH